MADPSNGVRSELWTADLRSRFDELVDEYRASLHDSLDGARPVISRLRASTVWSDGFASAEARAQAAS